MKWLLALLLCLSAAGVSAEQETRPFVRGSYERIVASHTGKPFVVSFWSLSCTNCREDLSMFGKLARKYPGFNLILIATDSPEQNREIEQTLQRYRLERAESWVFADSYAERLRFEVDREWYGELPRTYFFDAQGRVEASLSGVLDHAQTERWIREGSKGG
jgi:thiol-disulfide isomerase/thioredoxin